MAADRPVVPAAGLVDEEAHARAERNVARYGRDRAALERRLRELDREWGLERALGAGAAVATLGGLAMGSARGRGWLLLPAVAAGLVLQQALRGWSPAVPPLRRLGLRTAAEIDHERYALKVLRGDFQNLPAGPDGSDRAPVSRVLHAVEH